MFQQSGDFMFYGKISALVPSSGERAQRGPDNLVHVLCGSEVK